MTQFWWWPYGACAPVPRAYVGVLDVDGMGGSLQVGASIGAGGGGGGGGGSISLATTTGDFSTACVFNGLVVSTGGGQASGQSNGGAAAQSAGMPASQPGCVFTFKSNGTTATTRGGRTAPPRKNGSNCFSD